MTEHYVKHQLKYSKWIVLMQYYFLSHCEKNVLGYPLALVYTFKQRQGSTWDIMMNHISVHVSREFTLYLLLVQIAWYVFCTLRTPNSSCLSPFGVMQPEYNRNLDLNVCPSVVKKKNTKKEKILKLEYWVSCWSCCCKSAVLAGWLLCSYWDT